MRQKRTRNAAEKDAECCRKGCGMLQKRMRNAAKKDAECCRKGCGMLQKRMRNAAKTDAEYIRDISIKGCCDPRTPKRAKCAYRDAATNKLVGKGCAVLKEE